MCASTYRPQWRHSSFLQFRSSLASCSNLDWIPSNSSVLIPESSLLFFISFPITNLLQLVHQSNGRSSSVTQSPIFSCSTVLAVEGVYLRMANIQTVLHALILIMSLTIVISACNRLSYNSPVKSLIHILSFLLSCCRSASSVPVDHLWQTGSPRFRPPYTGLYSLFRTYSSELRILPSSQSHETDPSGYFSLKTPIG